MPMPRSSINDGLKFVVTSEPGITLSGLLQRVEGAANADVFRLIVRGELYVDLSATWLGDSDHVQVFCDRETARYFRVLSENQQGPREVKVADLIPGTTLLLDEIPLEVLHVGKHKITCYRKKYNDCPTFPNEEFEKWIAEGRVADFKTRPRLNRETDAYAALQSIGSRGEIIEALWNYDKIVKPYFDGKPITDDKRTKRTHRNLINKYKLAEAKWGNGLLGITPQHHKKGNATSRLALIHPDLPQMLEDFLDNNYETPTCPTKALAYGTFRKVCEAKGITPPGYKPFIKAIEKRAGSRQTKKMEGSRAAYDQEEWSDWDSSIPIHGDRPWEYAHIDHTVTDVVIRHTDKGVVMGRAWITVLIDSFSRRVLAYYMTYDPPSYRSCMGAIRECVRLHGRLPECFIVDGGSEFKSIYFERLLARYHCDIIRRPRTKPRFGAVIERFIHTMNKQFFHNLAGNTKIMKRARQVTKKVNPEALAVWTFPDLDVELENYLYQEYANRMHSGIGQSPLQAFVEGMEKFPPAEIPTIEYDNSFLIDTMPSTRTGTAKLFRSRGVKVFGKWYRSKKLRRAELYGKQLDVRYDPWNMAHAYAWDGKEWVLCLAPPSVYAKLKNRTEKEVKLISEHERELYRSYGRGFNDHAAELAEKHAPRKESERVQAQRLKDDEMRASAARRGIRLSPSGGYNVPPHETPADEKNSPAIAKPADMSKLKSFMRAKGTGRPRR